MCEHDLQIQRLMENRGMSEADSTAMINIQMPLETKSDKPKLCPIIKRSASV